jgi:hypothetical protein
LFIALFSILLPGRLVALDLDPVRVGGYDTSGSALGMAVSGNYAYVADGGAGLQVIDVSNPANPQRVGGYDTSGEARGVAVSGNYAYVTDLYAGLQVIDVSSPANPRRVGGNSGFGASDVVVAGTNVFVAAYFGGFVILDLFRPSLRLELVSPQQPGGFRLLVRGDAGLSVRVQRSANLRDWEDWQALTLGATPSELSDLDAGATWHRFYRAVTP